MSELTERRFEVIHQPGFDLRITDPAFEVDYTIESEQVQGDSVDGVFYEILTSPAGLRSLGINQLSKSPLEETYEGSADFKRWQHVAGVYKIVKKFGRDQGLSDTEILQYALVAAVPDLGHGVKSHATDIMIEGVGGKEKFHDTRAAQTIAYGGIEEILQKHDIPNPFDEDGKVTIDVLPWVECKAPDLNVDRLHYINAELALMFPGDRLLQEATKLSNFVITEDKRLAFRDEETALVWTKGALLCSTEHWNHPVNRLILLKSVESLKRSIFMRYLQNIEEFDNGHIGLPQDYTFLIDNHFDQALMREASAPRPDISMNEIYSILQSLGFHERERFANQKQLTYLEYLYDFSAGEYPNELVNPHRASFGVLPPMVEVLDSSNGSSQQSIEKARKDLHERRGAIYMIDGVPVGVLNKFKRRQFDPLVVTAKKPKRLSKINPGFKSLLEQSGRALDYVGAIALHIAPGARDALVETIRENGEMMEKSQVFPSLSRDQIRKIIRNAGQDALKLAITEGRWTEKT